MPLKSELRVTHHAGLCTIAEIYLSAADGMGQSSFASTQQVAE